MRNTDPFQKWNTPPENSDPFKPWNNPIYRDDHSAPWNDPFGKDRDYEKRFKGDRLATPS